MPAERAAGSESSGVRILVVEDELLVAMLLESMLAELGHEVIGPVARLDKAVAMAASGEFDVALLDVNIRGDESYPVADALAARNIPFIFATGYDPARLREPYRHGPILQKPFQLSTLKKIIDETRR